MRIKARFIWASIVFICFLTTGTAYSSDDWMMQLRVKAGDARNTLIIGQKADAIDGVDGRYDVPAMLSGDIEAYLYVEGNKYWKDVKQTCSTDCRKIWSISIESSIPGEVISFSWDPQNIPSDKTLILIDKETGVVTDMLSGQREYAYENSGIREFILVVEPWQ